MVEEMEVDDFKVPHKPKHSEFLQFYKWVFRERTVCKASQAFGRDFPFPINTAQGKTDSSTHTVRKNKLKARPFY